jgi:hypothetical protein
MANLARTGENPGGAQIRLPILHLVHHREQVPALDRVRAVNP